MSRYYRRTNPKNIALIVVISLLAIGGITLLILDGMGVKLNMIPVIIISGVLTFSLILTLSLIRYDHIREIRSDQYIDKENKRVFMTIYTDQITNICHDLKDESEHKNND